MGEIDSAKDRQLKERTSIHALEEFMHSLPDDEKRDIESLTSHFFAPGVYARMFVIKAGDVAIGKIHKKDHLNIVCKGRVRVSTEDGPMEIVGPCVFTARAGVKKAVYAIEDTTWINIHVTEKTDIDEIESEVIARDYAEVEAQPLKGGHS